MMAKKLFPNEEAVGQHVRYTIATTEGAPNDIEIIGVVNTHRHDVQNDTVLRRIFVPFADGKPSGKPQDILTGFLNDSGDAQGRPVGVRIDKQGALLVADDVGNTIWRVTPSAKSAELK